MSVSHCMATSSAQDWSLPASQVWGILDAREMMTRRDHTLHLAEASASAVLRLPGHQKYRQRREVLKHSRAGSWLKSMTCISAGLEESAHVPWASCSTRSPSSSISCRIVDTKDCKDSSIWMGCLGVTIWYSSARLLGLENSHLIPLTMLISWYSKPASRVTDHSCWLSKCRGLALPCAIVLLTALDSVCSVWMLWHAVLGDSCSLFFDAMLFKLNRFFFFSEKCNLP